MPITKLEQLLESFSQGVWSQRKVAFPEEGGKPRNRAVLSPGLMARLASHSCKPALCNLALGVRLLLFSITFSANLYQGTQRKTKTFLKHCGEQDSVKGLPLLFYPSSLSVVMTSYFSNICSVSSATQINGSILRRLISSRFIHITLSITQGKC